MKRAYTDVTDGQMHYRTEGSGRTLLLLHMAVSSSDEYERVIPFLSQNYRVIAPDYLGYGESDKPPRRYEMIDHAKSIIEFMDSLGIDKASIGGHHSGAGVSVAIAVNWPDRVDKIILSCLPYWRDDNERLKIMGSPNFQRVEIDPDGGHLLEWWRRAKRYGDPPDIVDERVLCMHKAGPRGEEIHWASLNFAANTGKMLPLVKAQTLVLAPSKDQYAPAQEDVQKLIPGSKLTIIKDGPVYIDRLMPREFAEAILAFLEDPGI